MFRKQTKQISCFVVGILLRITRESFNAAIKTLLLMFRTGTRPPVPSRTFELHWDQRCEDEWRCAFYCFATGMIILSTKTVNRIFIRYSFFYVKSGISWIDQVS